MQASPRQSGAIVAALLIAAAAAVVVLRPRPDGVPVAIPDARHATDPALDSAVVEASDEASPGARVETALTEDAAVDSGGIDAAAVANDILGDAGVPARAASKCTDAARARDLALERWVEGERARLAPKMSSARASKLLKKRMVDASDSVRSLLWDQNLCAESADGNWDIVFERFEGTTKADENAAELNPDDEYAVTRFFAHSLRGFAGLRFRGKDGSEVTTPLRLAGDAAVTFASQDGMGAKIVAPSEMSAGHLVGGPGLLFVSRRGQIDLIDNNPRLDMTRELLVVSSGVIAKQALPKGATPTQLVDVDGDGLGDFLTHGPYTAKAENAHGTPGDVDTLELLWHAHSDGTFSLNDIAARAHARRLCPKRPTEPLLVPPEYETYWHDSQLSGRIVCARLWGWTHAQTIRFATGPVAGWAGLTPPLLLTDDLAVRDSGDRD